MIQFNYVVVDDTFKACDYDIANINVAQFGQFVMASGGNTFFLDVATFMDVGLLFPFSYLCIFLVHHQLHTDCVLQCCAIQ